MENKNDYQVEGKLIYIGETIVISDSFKKREFVIQTEGEYPQLLSFELQQDNVSKLDTNKEGDNVTVKFNLRGRKWTNREGDDKYFNTLVCWSLYTQTPGARKELVDKLVGNDDLPF